MQFETVYELSWIAIIMAAALALRFMLGWVPLLLAAAIAALLHAQPPMWYLREWMRAFCGYLQGFPVRREKLSVHDAGLRRPISIVAASLLIIAALSPTVARAQRYSGSLTGLVNDPSGAVVPEAKVTLKDVANGFTYAGTTDSAGRYLLRPLPPGAYTLAVEAKGFKAFTQDGITLDVNQSASINVSLELGSATQSVKVTATAPLLATENATTGEEVNRTFINMMPLVGRGVVDLTFLSPGVNPAPGGAYGSIASEFYDNNFTSNGGRNATADVLVDGVSATGTEQNTGVQTVLYTPSVDDVQEFKVEQNSFSAEFGSTSNTVVNVVTRSGTNQFHGSLYEFFRHQAVDANNWFSNAAGIGIPGLRYNDFGGTVGGPVKKDKMFFFADYEGARQHSASTFQGGVPSAAERTGDFGELCAYAGGTFNSSGQCSALGGQLWDPYSGAYSPTVGGAVRSRFIPFNNLATYTSPGNSNLAGTPFQLSAQPGNLIDPVAQKIMSYFPNPNLNLGTPAYNNYNNWAGNGVNILDHDQLDVKIDRRFGSRDNLSGRLTYGRNPNAAAECFHSLMDPCTGGPSNFTNRAVALNDAYTITSSTVLTVSAGFTRELHSNPGIAAGYFSGSNANQELGFPSYMSDSGVDATPTIVIGGGYHQAGPLGSLGQQPWTIIRYAQETYDFTGILDHIQGRQEFKMGAEARVHRINEGQPGTPDGYFTYNQYDTSQRSVGANVGGDAMATFLTGTSTSGSGMYEFPAYTATINPEYAGFFQDNFRVSPRLTVNMGVRYELMVPRTERHDRLDWFDPSAPSPLGNIPGLGTPNGLNVYAYPGERRGTDINPAGIAPRIGTAYRLSSKLVFRGGYGIYFAPTEWGAVGSSGCTSGCNGFDTYTDQQMTYNYDGATPYARLSNPFPNGFILPLATPVPKGGDSLFGIGTYLTPLLRKMNNLPYIQTWNAGFQYELPSNIIITANYIGTRGVHLYFGGSPGLNYLGSWIEEASPSELASLATYVPNPFYGIVTNPNVFLSAPQVQEQQLLLQYPEYSNVWPGHAPRANNKYTALQLQLNKHFSHGVEFLANYTWSKNIDDASVGTNTTWMGGFMSLDDPNNLELERSVSEYNIPQVFNFAYIYHLPFGNGKQWGSHWNKWVDAFLGGWQTSGAWRFDDGQPFAASTWGTGALPFYSQRPDRVGTLQVNPRSKWFCSEQGCGYFANQGPGKASTDALVDPPHYGIGTAPRTLPNVQIPGTQNADLGIFKEISLNALREGSHLEFRAESFNALNHPQFCGPDSNIDDGNFGRIFSQCNSPREVQFGLKFYW